MERRRTTPALVETAIAGAQRAGLPIAAVDVHNGGFVRILITDPTRTGELTEANTCDDVFKVAST